MHLSYQLSDAVPPTALIVHYVTNNQITKIWCGILKGDAGGDGKQGIN